MIKLFPHTLHFNIHGLVDSTVIFYDWQYRQNPRAVRGKKNQEVPLWRISYTKAYYITKIVDVS